MIAPSLTMKMPMASPVLKVAVLPSCVGVRVTEEDNLSAETVSASSKLLAVAQMVRGMGVPSSVPAPGSMLSVLHPPTTERVASKTTQRLVRVKCCLGCFISFVLFFK